MDVLKISGCLCWIIVVDEEPLAKQARLDDSEAEDDDDPVSNLCRDTIQTQDLGPKVTASFAQVLTTIAQRGMTESALKQRTESVLVPENLPCLGDLPVNTEIFNTLPGSTRSTDKGLQYVHKVMTKGITTLVNVTDSVMTAHAKKKSLPSTQVMLKQLMDGLGLLMAANHQLHRERRRIIQPELKDIYKDLAKKDNPIEGNLFGPDLAQQVKELDEKRKVSFTLTKPHSSKGNKKHSNIFKKSNKNFSGYGSNKNGSGYTYNKVPFLDQRRGVHGNRQNSRQSRPYNKKRAGPQNQRN